MECHWCGRDKVKLYDHKGWKICWDCYWEDVDKDLGKQEVEQTLKGVSK